MTTINSIVTIGVTIGNIYESPLTISAIGGIMPAGSGQTALYASGSGYISNSGTISGSDGGDGIIPGDGAEIKGYLFVNEGSICGGFGGGAHKGGVGVEIMYGSMTNFGGISGGAYGGSAQYGFTGASGISLDGGTLVNSGTVSGGNGNNYDLNGGPGGSGISISSGVLINTGAIDGGNGSTFWSEGLGGAGVNMAGGLLVNNGIVTGGTGGSGRDINFYIAHGGNAINLESGTLINNGTVFGGIGGAGGDGINISGGILTNNGTISGADGSNFAYVNGFKGGDGVYLNNATIITSGLIVAGNGSETFNEGRGNGSASDGDAVQFGNISATLALEAGASFVGNVVGNAAANDTLELLSGNTEGTIDVGATFSGIKNISFGNSASWTLEGATSAIAGGEVIAGFNSSDVLIVDGFAATSETYVSGTGLIISDGLASETLDIIGSLATGSYFVTEVAGCTEVQLLCYLRGTRIATPGGELLVENLKAGDAVITRFKGYQRIKWIGRQSFSSRFIKNNRHQIPVRFTPGALGRGLPKRDLFVSPGHCMLLGESLVLAHSLINGITIMQNDVPEQIHYYQLEFDAHDCVLAEGVWSESFCDYADLRNQFHNVSEFHLLYPHHITPQEHRLCAPRPEQGLALASALEPVVARAAALTIPGPLRGWIDGADVSGVVSGWAQDMANPELPVLLEVRLYSQLIGTVLACDHRPDLAAEGIGQGRCAFSFSGPKIPRKMLTNLSVGRFCIDEELPMAPQCLARLAIERKRMRA